MLLNIIIPPRYYFFDSGGKALIGGYLKYSGLIYQDVFKTVPHQNPIRLDENGSALLYFNGECELSLYNRHGDYVKNEIIPTQNEWVFFYDKFGRPLKYGKVFIFRFRSSIEKESFYTADKSVLNANPVILDEDGKAKIFIDGAYRLRILTADSVLIADEDVYQLPLPKQFKYFLQSLKYPQFKHVHEYLQSNLYPQKIHYKLTSRIYPKWVKQHYVLTSLIFPYIDEEILNLQANVLNGYDLGIATDIMSINAKCVDGELRSIRKEYIAPLDDVLIVGAKCINGQLINIRKEYTAPLDDALIMSAICKDGELKRVLITYASPLEDFLTISATCVDGELKTVN